jgi:hypothetical protein
MKHIGALPFFGMSLLIVADTVPAEAQSLSTTRLHFVGTTDIKGGLASQLPSGKLFIQNSPEVDVGFDVPGVSGNNSPARLPASMVPKPAGNSIVTGSFFGFGGLTQFDQAISPTGNRNGFNFQVEPPDQGLTVGNGFVVETVNNAIAVFKTNGVRLPFESMSLFLGLAPGVVVNPITGQQTFGPFLSDPRAYFDASTGRFFVTELEINVDPATGNLATGSNAGSSIFIAVSLTNDPTGAWNVFQLDVSNDGDARFGACPCFGDQPLIGADQNGFYVSPNAFTIATPHMFRGEQLYAISKNTLETSSPGIITAVRFHNLDTGEGPARSIQPAIVPPGGTFESANNGTEYLVSRLDFTNTLDNRVGVWALTNTASLDTGTPSLALTNVVVDTEVYGQPPATDQKPGPLPFRDFLASPQSNFGTFKNHEELITANEDRMQQVVFSQGMLWTGLSSIVTPQGPVRVGAAWFIISPSDSAGQLSASVFNQGYVSISSPHQNSVMFPSVGVNAAGKAVIAFSVVGEDFFPSAGYALLDAVNGAGSIVISGPGVAPDDGFSGYAPFGNRIGRWGDYSAAASDENGNIWMGNEMIPPSFALPPGVLVANWGTFITEVAP